MASTRQGSLREEGSRTPRRLASSPRKAAGRPGRSLPTSAPGWGAPSSDLLQNHLRRLGFESGYRALPGGRPGGAAAARRPWATFGLGLLGAAGGGGGGARGPLAGAPLALPSGLLGGATAGRRPGVAFGAGFFGAAGGGREGTGAGGPGGGAGFRLEPPLSHFMRPPGLRGSHLSFMKKDNWPISAILRHLSHLISSFRAAASLSLPESSGGMGGYGARRWSPRRTASAL